MFGAESEQAEKERAERQAKYAEDLRKQIEENEGFKNKRFQSSASNQILNLNQISPRNQSWAPSQYMSKSSFSDNDQNLLKNDEINNDHYHNNYYFDNSNDDHYLNIEVKSPRTLYDTRKTNEIKEAFSFKIKNLEQQVQNLENTITRLLNIDLPMKIKPNEDAISVLNAKVEGFINKNTENNQSIRDKLVELNFKYSQVIQQSNDNNERLRTTSNDIRAEISRSNDAANSHFMSVDSKLEKIELSIKTIVSKQKQIEQAIADQSHLLSNSISKVQKNANIEQRKIKEQIEALHNETLCTFEQVNQVMQNSTIGLNESIVSLSDETQKSLQIIKDKNEKDYSLLKQQLETTSLGINQSFSTFQNDILQILSSCNSPQSKKSFENNEASIIEYQILNSAIEHQRSEQISRIELRLNSLEKNYENLRSIQYNSSFVSGKVNALESSLYQQKSEILSKLNSRLIQIEKNLEYQPKVSLSSLAEKLASLETSLAEQKNEIIPKLSSRLDHIERDFGTYPNISERISQVESYVSSLHNLIPIIQKQYNKATNNDKQLSPSPQTQIANQPAMIHCPQSKYQICLDINHDDFAPNNPQLGHFVLLIGEPRKSSRPGRHILKPRKFDQYIYPASNYASPEELKQLLKQASSKPHEPSNDGKTRYKRGTSKK